MAPKKDSDEKPSSKIENAKKKLFSKYAEIKDRPRSHLHPHKDQPSSSWSMAHENGAGAHLAKKISVGTPILKKFFIGSLIFLGITILIALFSLSGGRNVVSTNAIDIEILTKSFVDGGEPFDVVVEVTNKNSAALELADLILEYPKSSVVDGEMTRERRALDTIRSGQTAVEDFSIVLFGEEGEERTIKATLEYRVQGSNAIFVKTEGIPVAIQSTPIQILVDAPDEVINNQEMTLDVDVQSNSTSVTNDMMLRVEYPSGFKFTSADPEPSLGNNIWILGDLEAGALRTIAISGTVQAPTGEERTFRAFVGEQDPKNEKELITAFNSIVHVVAITTPFVGAQLVIDDSDADEVAITSGNKVSGKIIWTNTLPVQLNNVEVTALFSGNAFDPGGVDQDRGFFDSGSGKITWDRDTSSELVTLEPGESGTLTFSFIPRPLVNGNSVIDKPEMSIEVNVRGIDPNGQVRSASSVENTRIVINSDFQVTPKTLYFSGPFSNSGPYPPQSGSQTTLTLTWVVTNSSNAIDNAEITTTLPSYVDWVGPTAPNTETISFNSVKREVTWNIGNVDAGAGFGKPARQVSFQVAITPSTTQINQQPNLTSDVILSGEDLFTGVLLKNIRHAHTTKLLNDVQSGNGTVQ